ncbi:unnamed protein product [Malus baccata var. baccata]
MGCFLSRSVELVNETNPGVVIELTEVEQDDEQGRLIVKLQPRESKKIKGTQFKNRHLNSRTARAIHATALVSDGEPPIAFLPANDFAVHGKLVFRRVGEVLTYDAKVIPDFRRLRSL